MRNWPLAKRIMREMALRRSPFRNVLEDYILKAFGKYILVILLGFFGIILSINFSDWSLFSRSGCLITILAAVFLARDIDSNLIGKSKVTPLGELDEKATEKLIIEAKEICYSSDILVFIAGNVIWGFGDLIGKLLLI